MYSCTGCKQKPVPKTMAERLTELRDSFAFASIDSFEINGIDWQQPPPHLKKIDSANFDLIWQGARHAGDSIKYDYYYSWQVRDTNFIELTVLYFDESDYCSRLEYLVYNKKGKLLSHFPLAAECGDAGWAYVSAGKFIDSVTYRSVSFETNITQVDSLNNETERIDTVVEEYVIGYNGRTIERPVEKHTGITVDSAETIEQPSTLKSNGPKQK